MFCHLRIDIQSESAVDIFLRRRHFSQPALVLLHGLCLVRENNLCGDYNWEVDDDKFPQHTRKCRIGQVLQTDERIQQTPDFQVVIKLVLDVDVRYLASRAFVENRGFRTSIGRPVVSEGMERSLDFEEEIIARHSRQRHAGRLKCCFYSGH
jgi:hypothetical protein